jgi:hypothetical protein
MIASSTMGLAHLKIVKNELEKTLEDAIVVQFELTF